jgi:hypothetical protein
VNGNTDCGAAWFLARATAKLLTAKDAKNGREVRKESERTPVAPASRRLSGGRPARLLNGKTCRQDAGGTYAGEVFSLRPLRLRAFVVNATGLRLVFQQRINLTDTGFGGIERAGVVDDVVGLLNFL